MQANDVDTLLPVLPLVRCAIVVVDLVDSVRLMQQDESEVIARWRRFVAATIAEVLPRTGGRMVKSLGDGLLLSFEGCPQAVHAARAMNELLAGMGPASPSDLVLQIRSGVHVGEVFVDDIDVYGTAVNLAARLASLASPGGIVVSLALRDEIAACTGLECHDMGLCFVKNLAGPVRAFAVVEATGAPSIVVRAEQPDHDGAALRPSIAVVPFAAGDASPEGFALGDAFADDLIANLSRCPTLRVLSRLSTSRFRACEADDTDDLRVRLGADYAVLGRLRRSGAERTRVDVQLVELNAGEVVWAESYLTQASALFAGDDPVVPAVTHAIERAVAASAVHRTRRLPIPNLPSFTLFLGGTSLLHRLSETDFDRARTVLLSLSERVPRSAPPHAMLAKWHIFRMVQGWSADRTHDGAAARDAARRALDRDPEDAFSLAVQGLTASIVSADLDTAEACYQRALAANDNEPYAWALTSSMHSYRDRPALAVAAAERAIALSPADPALFLLEAHHALALLTAGHPAQAVAMAERSLQRNAMHTPSHRLRIIGLVLAGRTDEARVAARLHDQLEPHFSVRMYRERYPGRESCHAETHARALLAAGIRD